MKPAVPARADLASLSGDLARLDEIVAGWDEQQRNVVIAIRRAIEALHGEALRRLIREVKQEPAAVAALRRAAGDEVVYAVLRKLGLVKASLDERIEQALARVRPQLGEHGGDVELVRIEPPIVEVRLVGACDGCASSAMTFHAGVKQAVLDACPEINEVVQAKSTLAGGHHPELTSPFSLTQLGAWQLACALEDVPDGGMAIVSLRGASYIVARRGIEVRCFDNACAHLGLRLDGGDVRDGVLVCPHHGFEYDLGSGECLTANTVALGRHAARVIGTRVEVRLT